MAGVFALTTRRWGLRAGYRAGFAVYWAACTTIAVALLGRRGTREVFSRPRPLPHPRWLALAALALPPLGGVATQLAPAIGETDGRTLSLSAALATVNASAEELVWRGVPAAYFPDDRLRGWLLPALGFTAWHLVPLAAARSMRRAPGLLGGAALIGLGYGWVSWRTRSLRWTLPPHIVTDASGVRAVKKMWLS
jgi:membrane protease YdiL (CAAX protease family)